MKTLKAHTVMNWKYALGELCLIVLGVSIAMAAGVLYEERQDRLDEQAFLTRLHADILLAEELSNRVRDRRLEALASLLEASKVVNGQSERTILSDAQCTAIAGSSSFNISLSDLPSFSELASTGRIEILQNTDLRISLVGLTQIKGTMSDLVRLLLANSTNLSREYPEYVARQNYIDSDTGEIRVRGDCNVEKMRQSRPFLSELAGNIDTYDVYVRDGLLPWIEHFDKIHALVDDSLAIRH
jgi:hypothetical protein